MAARGSRRQAIARLTCETLEERALLTALRPTTEVRSLGGAGPLLRAPSLFIEPQAGRAPIVQAINSARTEIRLGICNLSDPQIGDALAAAVARGVNVEVIVDQADYHNKPPEQAPSPDAMPYMHAKTMIVGGRTAYLGSIDIETTEASQDRELGIVFRQRPLVRQLNAQFQSDWNRASLAPS